MKMLVPIVGLVAVSLFSLGAEAQSAVSPTPPVSAVQAQPQTPASTVIGNSNPATDPGAAVRPPLPTAKDPSLPTIYLVGDSTVRNGKAAARAVSGGGANRWSISSTLPRLTW